MGDLTLTAVSCLANADILACQELPRQPGKVTDPNDPPHWGFWGVGKYYQCVPDCRYERLTCRWDRFVFSYCELWALSLWDQIMAFRECRGVKRRGVCWGWWQAPGCQLSGHGVWAPWLKRPDVKLQGHQRDTLSLFLFTFSHIHKRYRLTFTQATSLYCTHIELCHFSRAAQYAVSYISLYCTDIPEDCNMQSQSLCKYSVFNDILNFFVIFFQ